MIRCKKTKRSSFYYHVTREDMGNKVILSPRAIRCCDEREPDIDRICVSPTISGCFAAITICSGAYNIYRTKNKILAHIPKDVSDVSVTKEKWLLEPAEFIRIGRISQRIVSSLPDGARGDDDELWNQLIEKRQIKSIINNNIRQNRIRMRKFEFTV